MYMVAIPGEPAHPPLLVFLEKRPAPEECPFPIIDDVQFTPLPPDGESRPTSALVAEGPRGRDYREVQSLDDAPEGFTLVPGVQALSAHSWATFKMTPLGSSVSG